MNTKDKIAIKMMLEYFNLSPVEIAELFDITETELHEEIEDVDLLEVGYEDQLYVLRVLTGAISEYDVDAHIGTYMARSCEEVYNHIQKQQ